MMSSMYEHWDNRMVVRRPDKTATDTTMPKGKYTESLTFSTPNCIYANYGKLGKPSLQGQGQGRCVFHAESGSRKPWKGGQGLKKSVECLNCHRKGHVKADC